MSFRAVCWAWDQKQLTPPERLTLLSLTQFSSKETEECWPRVKTIALDAGISVSSVNRSLKSLAEKGLIHISHKHREDGGLSSSLYKLLIPPPTTVIDPFPHKDSAPSITVIEGTAAVIEQEPVHRTQPYEPIQKNPIKRSSSADSQRNNSVSQLIDMFRERGLREPVLANGAAAALTRLVKDVPLVEIVNCWADISEGRWGTEWQRNNLSLLMIGRWIDPWRNAHAEQTKPKQRAVGFAKTAEEMYRRQRENDFSHEDYELASKPYRAANVPWSEWPEHLQAYYPDLKDKFPDPEPLDEEPVW